LSSTVFAYIVGRLSDIGESSGSRHIDESSLIEDGEGKRFYEEMKEGKEEL
jgi:hypothetical protein